MDVALISKVDNLAQPETFKTSLIVVSAREVEVLQLISRGLTVKEIAHKLHLSTHTIISHKKNLVEKFDAKNAIDLIVKAIKMNVISIF